MPMVVFKQIKGGVPDVFINARLRPNIHILHLCKG